ncbi:MAG: carboxypeptidase regulatory-like domain-containing protein [Microbacterium sp.]
MVLDDAGRPVSDAAVAVVAAPVAVADIAALTGPDGRFTIAVPEPGGYTILATAPDSRSSRVPVWIDADAAETQVEIRVT